MKKKWWHNAIGYQIYPKSFQDTNGDGIGDIKGIIQHLNDLQDLGVTVIWVSPINVSPMMDHGYDISDYFQIDPSFGSNEDMEELIQEANKRDIKILMDLVINHTSDQHEWFKNAMSNLDCEFADYYVIKEGKNGEPPNNWRSMFGGSAWEKIKETDKYYLHLFTVGQPDLNWENPKLRQELYKVINYWLDKGLAGYRIDAIAHIKKIYEYDNLPADGADGLVTTWKHYRNAEGIGEFLGEMRDTTFKERDVLTIAEMDVENPEKWEEYFGEDGYFSSIFDFFHTPYSVQSDKWREKPIELVETLKEKLFEKQKLAYNHVFFTNFIENHDLSRSPNRFIPKEYIGFESESLLATIYFFLRGIPVIYQGQEIGMLDYPKKKIDGYVDLATHNSYENYLLEGYSKEEALKKINIECRENSRTPVQWNDEKEAGFTTGTSWFPVNPSYTKINYKAQRQDKNSLLNYYKKITSLRKDMKYEDIFVYGETIPLFEVVKGCVSYCRQKQGEAIFILTNCTSKDMGLTLQQPIQEVLLNNLTNIDIKENQILLKPFQAIVFK